MNLKFFSSDPRFSRWKRRFGNRAEIDSSPADEILPEAEDNIPLGRPYLLNNKIYPGLQQEESVKEKVIVIMRFEGLKLEDDSRLRIYVREKFSYKKSSVSSSAPFSPC